MEKVNSYKVLEVIDDGKHKDTSKKELNKKETNNPRTGISSITPIAGVLILNLINYKKNKGSLRASLFLYHSNGWSIVTKC